MLNFNVHKHTVIALSCFLYRRSTYFASRGGLWSPLRRGSTLGTLSGCRIRFLFLRVISSFLIHLSLFFCCLNVIVFIFLVSILGLRLLTVFLFPSIWFGFIIVLAILLVLVISLLILIIILLTILLIILLLLTLVISLLLVPLLSLLTIIYLSIRLLTRCLFLSIIIHRRRCILVSIRVTIITLSLVKSLLYLWMFFHFQAFLHFLILVLFIFIIACRCLTGLACRVLIVLVLLVVLIIIWVLWRGRGAWARAWTWTWGCGSSSVCIGFGRNRGTGSGCCVGVLGCGCCRST